MACLTFCFSYVSHCLHTLVRLCACVFLVHDPPCLAECCVTIPAWDHCEVWLSSTATLLHILLHTAALCGCYGTFGTEELSCSLSVLVHEMTCSPCSGPQPWQNWVLQHRTSIVPQATFTHLHLNTAGPEICWSHTGGGRNEPSGSRTSSAAPTHRKELNIKIHRVYLLRLRGSDGPWL